MNDPYYLQIRSGIESYLSSGEVEIVRIFKNDTNRNTLLDGLDGLICLENFPKRNAPADKLMPSCDLS